MNSTLLHCLFEFRLINIYNFREMDIHFISIAATQDIYLDIWRNIKNQPS